MKRRHTLAAVPPAELREALVVNFVDRFISSGYTQRELAKAAGVSHMSLHRFLHGRHMTDPVTLYKLSRVLKVKMERLFEESRESSVKRAESGEPDIISEGLTIAREKVTTREQKSPAESDDSAGPLGEPSSSP